VGSRASILPPCPFILSSAQEEQYLPSPSPHSSFQALPVGQRWLTETTVESVPVMRAPAIAVGRLHPTERRRGWVFTGCMLWEGESLVVPSSRLKRHLMHRRFADACLMQVDSSPSVFWPCHGRATSCSGGGAPCEVGVAHTKGRCPCREGG
jgi:hypothetical protein